MGKIDEYRYSLLIYDGLKVSRGLILGFDLEATRCFRGVYWHPTFLPAECAISPGPIPVGAATSYSFSGVQ